MSEIKAGTKVIVTKSNHPTEYSVGDILEVILDYSDGDVRVKTKHGKEGVVFRGQWEAYMPEFKVGDKVVTTAANAGWSYELGVQGKVIHFDIEEPKVFVEGVGYVFTSDLKLVEPEPLAEWEKELLAVTPRSIAFKDIQVGDKIKSEYPSRGMVLTREGVVARKSQNGDSENEYGLITSKATWNATYTLLERPEPPKPNPFAEAKVGSIATYGEEGIKYLKTGDDAWSPISRKGTLSGYRNSDESMTNCGDLIQVTHNA